MIALKTKNILKTISSLAFIFFNSILTSTAEEIQLELKEVRAIKGGNATTIVIGMTNISDKPIKAFRATLSMKNDFDEIRKVCNVEFTSNSEYTTDNKKFVKDHIIKPKETIWYEHVAFDDGREVVHFSKDPQDIKILKEKFILTVTKIAYDKVP